MFHTHLRRASIALSLLAVLAGAMSWPAAAQHYAVTNLGPLPGGSINGGFGINNNGQVVGWSDNGQTDQYGLIFHAVVWQNGTITDLGTLPDGTYSQAYGINNTGQVVGYSDDGQTDDFGGVIFHAVVWQNGAITDLGNLPGGISSQACSINDTGQTVGTAYDANGFPHAALWQNGTITTLGALPGNGDTYAYGINNTGLIVGSACNAHMFSQAALWQNGKIEDLNSRVLQRLGLTSANAVNDSGQIVCAGQNPFITYLLTPRPVPLKTLTLTPSTVHGGATAVGKVGLDQPAPPGGVMVSLFSSNPAASVPTSVIIPQGATSATFSITTTSVTQVTLGNITAGYHGVTKNKTFTVKP